MVPRQIAKRAAPTVPVPSLADGTIPTLDWGTATDVGRVRDLNEDVLLAEVPLFLVADGMGGHAAGEVAAELARRAMQPLIARDVVGLEDILGSIERANATIVERSAREGTMRGMGTTLAGICLGSVGGSPHWFVFNVGDSRVYRYADGALEQMTIDHSEVAELMASGQITADEARVHPDRNVITRSLGVQPPTPADTWVVPARGGETYLVCSDGLTSEVADGEIAEVLGLGLMAQSAADELCQRALAAGGHDNVSVVVVRILGDDVTAADVATGPRPRPHEGAR